MSAAESNPRQAAPDRRAPSAALRVHAAPDADFGSGLAQHLAALAGVLKELLDTTRRKLAAIRRADVESLNSCTQQEAALLEQACRVEQERPALLAQAAQSLRLDNGAPISLWAIAEKCREPIASIIRARMRGLHEIAAALQRENRFAALVARDLQKHIRGVFRDLANVNRQVVGYGPRGREERTTGQAWIDAVG